MSKKSESNQYHKHLAHPKYWTSWAMVGLCYLFSLTPLRFKLFLGKKLGPFLKRKLKSRAATGRKNIRACFPQLSQAEVEQLLEDCFTQMTMGALEGPHAWFRDMKPYQETVNVIGMEHLIKAYEKGHGVLIMGGHFAAVDFIIPLFAAKVVEEYGLGYMYRPADNPVIDRMIVKGRHRHGVTGFTKREIKDMIAYIKDGGMVWYGCDQDFGRNSDLFVPFFSVMASNISTPSWIVNETGAAVVFMSMHRLGDGAYQFEFSEELPKFGEDPEKDALAWNQELEKAILKYPSQYFWLHRRFKKRPPGEPKFY